VDTDSLKAFLQDLQSQLGFYREMLDVNANQLGLLDNPDGADADSLLNLVAQKQGVMERIAELEVRLAPHKAGWADSRDDLPPEVRRFADGLLAELSRVIEELIEQEDATHRRLEAAMGQTREGINTIRKKAQVNKAYAAYGGGKPSAARFLDQRGEGN
jgi:hypothetical protein